MPPRAGALLLLVLLLWPGVVRAGDDPWRAKPECVFGMPYVGLAVMPRQEGMVTRLLRRIFEPEGVAFRHEPMPYYRAEAELERGLIQCSLVVGDVDRQGLRARRPLLFYDLSVARLVATPWKGIRSLQGKSVAYVNGFDLDSLLGVRLRKRLVYDLSSAFPLLEDGSVAYALDDVRLLRRALRESRLPGFHFVIDPVRSFPVRPIFAPTAEGRRFRDIYDRRMRELAASGELAELLAEAGLPSGRVTRLIEAQ